MPETWPNTHESATLSSRKSGWQDAVSSSGNPREDPVEEDVLWRVLETVPGLCASRLEWKMRAGDEFARIEPYLRVTGEIAHSYPCPNRTKAGCFHRVVEHGPDDIVGVCSWGCRSVSLKREDLLIDRIDLSLLGKSVATVLHLFPMDELLSDVPHTRLIGSYSLRAGYKHRVYLTVQWESRSLLRVIENLAATTDDAFVLLAPTWALECAGGASILSQKKALFLTLCENLSFGGADGFQVIGPLHQKIKEFAEGFLPLRGEHGMVFFKTPPDAHWEDIELTFENEHEVHVECQGTRGRYSYIEMGMRNKNTNQPLVQWETLRAFAETEGALYWSHKSADRRNQKRIERLSKSLQQFFGLESSPIVYDQSERGWLTRFSVRYF